MPKQELISLSVKAAPGGTVMNDYSQQMEAGLKQVSSAK